MFCRIIPKLIKHEDVCELSDDGNPGAFNAFKHFGKGIGALCLFLDLLKGFLPVLLASLFLDAHCWAFALVLIAPVAGHAIGAFNGFRGGKCIAVSFGATCGLIPVTWIPFALLAVFYIAFSTVIKITPNRRRSIAVFALFGIGSCIACAVSGLAWVAVGCGIISAIAIVKHLKAVPVNEEELIKNEE